MNTGSDRRAILGAAVVLAAVLAAAGWRSVGDTSDWAAVRQEHARSGVVPDAPIPETGQMRRRRGQD